MKVLQSTIILPLALILQATCLSFHPKTAADLVHDGQKKLDALQLRTDIKKKLRTLTDGKSKLADEAQARLEVIRKQLQELMERREKLKPRVNKIVHELVKNDEKKKKRWHKLRKDVRRVMSRASIVGESRTKEVETTTTTSTTTAGRSIILQPEDLYS